MSLQRADQHEVRSREGAGSEELPVHERPAGGAASVGDYELSCSLLAPLPIQDVFRVFENAGNLARITPPWLKFRVLTGDLKMRAGAEIDYVIRLAGVPMKWRTLILDYEPPNCFIDLQTRGPYSLWHHRHDFTVTPEGTLVSDCVNYRLPLGPLGRLAHGVMVRRQLIQIFRYRQSAMPELLGVPCRSVTDPVIRKI